MPTLTALIALLSAALFVTGCSAPPDSPAASTEAPAETEAVAEAPASREIIIPAADYRRAFEAAIDSLKDHGFLIDRRDFRFGTITSKPRNSPKLFEIWKTDNTTAEQSIASSINSQQRIVIIQFTAGPENATTNNITLGQFALAVRVNIERTTDPNRRLTGSTTATDIVHPLDETPEQFKRQGVHGKSTHFIERDAHFEQRLLTDIAARLAAPPIENATAAPSPNGQ